MEQIMFGNHLHTSFVLYKLSRGLAKIGGREKRCHRRSPPRRSGPEGETWDVPEEFVGSPEDPVGRSGGPEWAQRHRMGTRSADVVCEVEKEDTIPSSTWAFRHMGSNEPASPASWNPENPLGGKRV